MRGLDQYLRSLKASASISARGIALVDCGGGEARTSRSNGLKPSMPTSSAIWSRYCAMTTRSLPPVSRRAFVEAGGAARVFMESTTALSKMSSSPACRTSQVGKMLDYAIELHGDSLIDDHIKSATNGGKTLNLEEVQGKIATRRAFCGNAERPWGRRHGRRRRRDGSSPVSWMEEIAREYRMALI